MNTTVNEINNKTVESVIIETGKKNPDFQITLDQLQKETGLDRNEIVKQSRALKIVGIKYKVGRKGHPSVILGGQKAKDFKKSAPIQVKTKLVKAEQETTDYSLNIKVGEQSVSLPIHLELVAA